MGEKHRTGSPAHITSWVALSETQNAPPHPRASLLISMKSGSKAISPTVPSRANSRARGNTKGGVERSRPHSFFQQMSIDYCFMPVIVLRALPPSHLIRRGRTEEAVTLSSCCKDLQRLIKTAHANETPPTDSPPAV